MSLDFYQAKLHGINKGSHSYLEITIVYFSVPSNVWASVKLPKSVWRNVNKSKALAQNCKYLAEISTKACPILSKL